jgi:NAD(P)H-dependent FMN reductase
MSMTDGQDALKVLIIIGSTRPTRIGGAIGEWVAEQTRQSGGWDVTVADLRELDLPMMNEPKHPSLGEYEHSHTKQWSALVAQQEAFIIVLPEYNHSYTAPVKNALDYLSREWQEKPAGLVSYGGISAGLRAATALKPVLSAFRMVPITAAVSIPNAGQQVQDGVFVATDSALSSATTMLKELRRWAVPLKPLRANIG